MRIHHVALFTVLVLVLAALPAQAQVQSFALTEGPGKLISSLISAGYGSLNLYNALVTIQSNANPSVAGVITPAFLAKIQVCPKSSPIIAGMLSAYAGSKILISTDCTVVATRLANGAGQNGGAGVTTLAFTLPGVGAPAAIVSSATPFYIFDPTGDYGCALGADATCHHVFAIAYAPQGPSQTFVLSDETPGRLITNLVAGSYGNLNLYQALVAIQTNTDPAITGVITYSFIFSLAGCAVSDPIWATQLKNYVGSAVAINDDCTVQTTSLQGSTFSGQTGTTTASYVISGVGPATSVSSTSSAPLSSWTQSVAVGSGTATVTYSVFAILYAPSPPLRFVPMTPCRVVDTRNAAGPFGGPSIGGGASRDFNVPTGACGVPSTAQAYSLNVAVVPAGPLGYLTLWPTGQTQPYVSTVNSLDGRTKSNAAIVPAGTGGSISVFASNATDVVLDINGYFVPATVTTAPAFYPITPCRIADTRNATAPLGGPSLAGGSSRTFPILSSACGIPATAQAYSLNFAAVPSGPLGYVTAWPTGQTMPLAASLNALTGTVTANAAIVPAGTAGSINVFASNATNLVIDVNGYFAPMATGGLSLYGVPPCRVVDTRLPAGSPPITSLVVAVSASACGIPSTAQADVLSVTVVPPGPLGYMTLWPQGQTMPVVSTLNALDGAVTSNLAIVPTINGSISVYPSNPTHVVMDISGYFGQ
jgi:hypothetical protein